MVHADTRSPRVEYMAAIDTKTAVQCPAPWPISCSTMVCFAKIRTFSLLSAGSPWRRAGSGLLKADLAANTASAGRAVYQHLGQTKPAGTLSLAKPPLVPLAFRKIGMNHNSSCAQLLHDDCGATERQAVLFAQSCNASIQPRGLLAADLDKGCLPSGSDQYLDLTAVIRVG